MTPIDALTNLYQASQLAPLTAEQHRLLAQSAKVLEEIIKPKEDERTDK